MSGPIYVPSNTVLFGRNIDGGSWRDDKYVFCRRCNFINQMDRSVRSPRGARFGDGLNQPSTQLDGSVSVGASTITVDATTGFSTPSTGIVTAYSDVGQRGKKVTCTSTGHGLSNENKIEISGTTSYNGTFKVLEVATDTFVIHATFVADDATGTWYKPEYIFIHDTAVINSTTDLRSNRVSYTGLSSTTFTGCADAVAHTDNMYVKGDVTVSQGCSQCGTLLYDIYEKDII